MYVRFLGTSIAPLNNLALLSCVFSYYLAIIVTQVTNLFSKIDVKIDKTKMQVFRAKCAGVYKKTLPILFSQAFLDVSIFPSRIVLLCYVELNYELYGYRSVCTNPWNKGENYQEWIQTPTTLYFKEGYRRTTLCILVCILE